MSGFASFAHAQATFCRSPPAPTSQPIRTSPLKSSFVPPSIPSSSRSASPNRADSDGTNSDAGISSDGASDDTGDLSSDAESDLVFFGTPTAQQLEAIARLSHAIPGTPGFSGTPTSSSAATFASPFATPSRKVRRVKKRDSREYLRRQTIVHQPYLGTPVRSAIGQDKDEGKAKAKGKGKGKGKGKERAIPLEQAQDRQAGKKVWPGGFFERPQSEDRGDDEEGESEYAPTPVRLARTTQGQKSRRATLSPERVHHDCELTFDFHRLGLSTPVPVGAQSTFVEETQRRPRRSSSASSGLTGVSEMGDMQAMEFSADAELADSDKENCPAPYDQARHSVEAEEQEAEVQIRTDGLLDASFNRAVIFEEDEQGLARALDMGGLKIDDYGDEDVGGVVESDDGELSDSSADMDRGSPPPEEYAESMEVSAAASLEDGPEMIPETEEGAAEGAEEGVEETAEEGAEDGAEAEARKTGEATGQDEIQGKGEPGRAEIAVCAQFDFTSGEDASPTVSRVLSPLAHGTTSPAVSAAASPALSQSSPASSATSSPLPMARAPARIPVIPHFSPILDTALSPCSPVSDLQHEATHAHPAHFASPSPFSDPVSLSGLPSRPRQPLYATPTDSPYVTAPSRPIRTPVPLFTPTPAPRITSGAGPALSTPTTRSRGNLGVPSKLALRSQLMSSTNTVPQSIVKAREQAESRKESPETAALKQKMREEQREAAMLASAVKPRAVSASAAATGQSALSTSVSARGRLGMGPPTRPGSAMSVSSSTSSETRSTAEQRSVSSRSMPSGKSGSSASASTSASSRSAVSRSIPLASRSTSSSTRARVAMLDRPASATSVSSASSTGSRSQQTTGVRLAPDKKSASASTSASARSVLGTRAAPSLSGSTTHNPPRPPTAVPKQSSLPSRLTASGPLSASNLNAAPIAARVTPARLSGLKRPRTAVPAVAPRTAVAVSSGPVSMGGAVRGALGAHGPPARVVGNRTIPLMSTRPVSPPSPVLHSVADIPSPVAQPSHFTSLYAEPPHYDIGAEPVAVPTSVMRPSGGYGLGGAACRPAPGSTRKNKIFMGTPSRSRTGLTPSKRPAVRPQPIPFDNVFRSIAAGGIASDRSNGNGPEHFVSSLDSPAGNTRSRPDGPGDTQPASSPSKPARGSSEDFAEVSFMMPHAASSSETGSSPVKRSGKTPSLPLQALTPDEAPSSPPVTRSASQSPTNRAKAKRATSAPASRAGKTTITKPTPSRPASRTDTIVPNMTEKELKTKTAFNTAKNEKRQCAIDRQVIHNDAPRPPSPTSKIPTTAAREEKEKKMGRDERARRRKQDEEDAKADLGDMLVKREERLQAPGDEEAWVYEDADESKEEDVSGPARKRTKTSHEEGDERAKRRVKWDKGVVVIRDFGEGLGKLAKPKSDARSGSALGGSKDGNSPDSGSSSMGSQSLRMKSILSIERRVELDQYGNLVTTKTAFTVKPQKVVVQAIFYQGEEPYVAPAAATRGKKKSA